MNEFPENNPNHLSGVLAAMIKDGMLIRITRNRYHIPPNQADIKTYIPDRMLFAKHLMQDRAHYIGYASALRVHGLTLRVHNTLSEKEQAADVTEYIVTRVQMKPATESYNGTNYRFIHHCPNRFFGYESLWRCRLEKVFVSDLEKTIVDIATKPRFSGGISELANTLFQARRLISPEKLLHYLTRNRNKSAMKRVMFLTELLGLKWTPGHDRLMGEIGTGLSLLDPSAQARGKVLHKYGLKINVDPDLLKDRILGRSKRTAL